ncbi:MAG: TetR/AcrR family transcriptional regulator [Nitrospirae bacterium]|jgi:AcrR family transcriptional regulator|nr:TetR/AcrR family transcriptional regulator [Nitrospirota bacterium]
MTSDGCDKSQQRKREILSAALSCFAEEGYHATTNRKIACRAGITEGLIYHYFPNKKALLSEIIEANFHRDCSPLYRFLSGWEVRKSEKKVPLDPDQFPMFLHDLGKTVLDSMDQNKDVHRVIVSEFRLLEEDGEPLYPKLLMELSIQRIVALFEWWNRSLALDSFSPSRDVWFFTGPLFAFFHFQEILSGKKVFPIDRTDFLEGLIAHFLKGIGWQKAEPCSRTTVSSKKDKR